MFEKKGSKEKQPPLRKAKPVLFGLIVSVLVAAFLIFKITTLTLKNRSDELMLHDFILCFSALCSTAILAMSMFNPRLKITIQDKTLFPGATTVLEWKLRGNLKRVKSLCITFLGIETAKFAQVKHFTFRNRQIIWTRDIDKISSGSIPFEIPLDEMHSFKSARVKISWHLIIQAEIAGWVDINDDYILHVRPVPLERGN